MSTLHNERSGIFPALSELRSGKPDELAARVESLSRALAESEERYRALAAAIDDKLAQIANLDSLTGLPNRALFHRRLDEEISHATREGRGLAVLMMDVDGFKVVNDTLGHAAGDRLLEMIAQRVSRSVRGEDVVARVGGDELAAILVGVSEAQQALAAANRVLAAVSMPIDLAGHEIFVGVSIGIAVYPEAGIDGDALQRAADQAMARAKRAGKNRCRVYSPEMSGAAPDRLTLESQLRRAIERDQLVLHCQPKTKLVDGALAGFEVLIRWQHPERGLLPPGVFLGIAEESGIIVPMGVWALRRACMQSAAWVQAGRTPARVAVNVSMRQLEDGGFVEAVARTLEETGLPARLLEIEVTENAIMRDPDASARELAALRSLGVTIAVDDFGTGYSSLSYLQRLPIDLLKIDRSFVSAMEGPATTLPLVQAIISMARALGLAVVAEGVETQRQLDLLRDLGCDEVQGFLIGRPIPCQDFAERWIPVGHGSSIEIAPPSAPRLR
jgi:diguanylate cyclase (GGDEF)-like protein